MTASTHPVLPSGRKHRCWDCISVLAQTAFVNDRPVSRHQPHLLMLCSHILVLWIVLSCETWVFSGLWFLLAQLLGCFPSPHFPTALGKTSLIDVTEPYNRPRYSVRGKSQEFLFPCLSKKANYKYIKDNVIFVTKDVPRFLMFSVIVLCLLQCIEEESGMIYTQNFKEH